jgi:hypothetical protein
MKTASYALAFDANTATPKAKAAKARITPAVDPPFFELIRHADLRS